jgi:hypothetical protein
VAGGDKASAGRRSRRGRTRRTATTAKTSTSANAASTKSGDRSDGTDRSGSTNATSVDDAGRAEADAPVRDSAHDRVWAALRAHPATTPADLSAASGVARSTVAKLLVAWAADGSATSTTGDTPRAARRWTAKPSDLTPLPDTESSAAQVAADDGAGDGSGDGSDQTGTRGGVEAARGDRNRRGSDGGPTRATVNRSGSRRLAPGALQGLVQDYLTDHPGEHGPTALGRALGRSSGAIANALQRLVDAGWAELAGDRPRRYRGIDKPDRTDHAAATDEPSRPDQSATTTTTTTTTTPPAADGPRDARATGAVETH